MPLDRAAPLLCAGITTYSPLRHYGAEGRATSSPWWAWAASATWRVKFGEAMGAEVTVLSTSPSKRETR